MASHKWDKVVNMENELQEEFRKIDKMNSHERLVYLREYIQFHISTGPIAADNIEHIFERILLVTKGYEGDGKGSLLLY